MGDIAKVYTIPQRSQLGGFLNYSGLPMFPEFDVEVLCWDPNFEEWVIDQLTEEEHWWRAGAKFGERAPNDTDSGYYTFWTKLPNEPEIEE